MTAMTRTGIRSIVFALVTAAAAASVASAQTPTRSAAPAKPAATAPQTPAKPAAPAPANPTPAKPPAPAPAQPAAAVPAPQASAAVPAPAAEAPPDVYSYNPEGRRDPFVSLIIKGSESHARDNRPEGAAGLSISEITLRGIVKSRSEYVALLQGPDKKTYIVHAGDKLFDGSVKLIGSDAIVFSEDVNDPLSLVKQREVRKPLRSTEEGK